MLGHFWASSLAEAVVIRRQLLPPKPSRKAIVAFFGPHHDGVSACAADPATPRIRAAAVRAVYPFIDENFMFFPPLLTGFLSLFGSPNRIDGDTKSKRESLNDCLCRIRHADSERELAQLIEKECRDRRGGRESATAGQRSAAENHNGD